MGWSTERAISLRDDYEPGELGFDPLRMFPDKPAEREEMLLKELNNGRLAMVRRREQRPRRRRPLLLG